MNGCGYASMEPYLQKQAVGQIWCMGHNLVTPELVDQQYGLMWGWAFKIPENVSSIPRKWLLKFLNF